MFHRYAILVVGLSAAAWAAPLTPASYGMRNGDGTATGGSFNYWDKEYTGSGSTTTDGALLSGGLGNLTDGVIATQNWNSVENTAGTGPYVGWRTAGGLPVITFNFAGTRTFSSMVLYLDDSETGGVNLPASARVQVGAYDNTFAIGPQPGTAPKAITLNLPGVTGSSLILTLNFGTPGGYSTDWIFMSEVTFDGREDSTVPEPSTLGLFAAGALALAVLRRL